MEQCLHVSNVGSDWWLNVILLARFNEHADQRYVRLSNNFVGCERVMPPPKRQIGSQIGYITSTKHFFLWHLWNTKYEIPHKIDRFKHKETSIRFSINKSLKLFSWKFYLFPIYPQEPRFKYSNDSPNLQIFITLPASSLKH